MHRHAEYIPFVSSGTYPLRAGNFVRPLVDGKPAFRRICQAVEAARKSVWVTVAFIQRAAQMPDARGTFFDVLDRAKARGIDVRALFWRSPEVEAVAPGTHFSGTEEERGFLAERGSRFLARWDKAQKLYCHHQKSWMVDAGEPTEVAFVGGINLDQKSVAAPGHAPNGGEQLHDVYVELRGPAATDVHHNFVQRWNEASERGEGHGLWPDAAAQTDLAFPKCVSAAAGEIPVQIQRTVRRGMYRDGTPTPGGERFAIEQGDYSICDQYLRAIDSARRSIYLEDQAIGSVEIVDALHAALRRDVQVVFLVPGKANPDIVAMLRRSENQPFRDALDGLAAYPSFGLVAIAASCAEGQYQDIYVHSKIALIDDAWCTIGSTNLANRSFYGSTELNASFWHAQTVRRLRRELFQEHTGADTADLDDRVALQLYARRARENTEHRARGEPLKGLSFALDPTTYAR